MPRTRLSEERMTLLAWSPVSIYTADNRGRLRPQQPAISKSPDRTDPRDLDRWSRPCPSKGRTIDQFLTKSVERTCGRGSRGPAHRAARPEPFRHQPQDGEDARAHNPALGAGAGG